MTDERFHILAARLDRVGRLQSHLAGIHAAIGATAVFTIILPAIAGAVGRHLS